MAATKPESPSPRPSDGTPTDGSSTQRWSTRTIAIASAVAVVIIVAVVLALTLRPSISNTATTDSTKSPTPAPSVTMGASASPSATAEPNATAGPSPASPVAITKPATILPGLTAAITKFESVAGKAQTPGEISGPSVRMTVTITNSTAKAVTLNTTVVTAYYGTDQTPALQLTSPGGVNLPTSVAPGASATGVYIFTIPTDQRANVRVEVDYSVDVAPLIFQGSVPS